MDSDKENYRALYEKARRIYKICNRSLGVFILPWVVTVFTHFFAYSNLFLRMGYDPFAAGGIPLVISGFIGLPAFYSMMRLTSLYDEKLLARYRASEDKTFLSRLKLYLTYPRFWWENLVYTALFWILPQEIVCGALTEWIFGGHSSFLSKLQIFVVLAPLYFALNLLARDSASTIWKQGKLEERDERNRPISYDRAYTQHMIMACILYPIGGCGLQLIVPLVISFLPLVGEILASEFMIWVCIFAAGFYAVRYGRAALARKKFLKRLNSLTRGNVKVRYPYRSLFGMRAGESFTVYSKGKEYSCKLVSAPRPLIPMWIHSYGAIEFLYVVRFLNIELFRHTKKYEIDYEADCQKVLIIQPRPKRVYGAHEGHAWALDNGDRVGAYRIFTAGAFLNTLERECLDK